MQETNAARPAAQRREECCEANSHEMGKLQGDRSCAPRSWKFLDAWFRSVGSCAPRVDRQLQAMGGGSGKEVGEWMDLTCCGRVSTDRGETRLPAELRDALLLPTATHRIFDWAL